MFRQGTHNGVKVPSGVVKGLLSGESSRLLEIRRKSGKESIM